MATGRPGRYKVSALDGVPYTVRNRVSEAHAAAILNIARREAGQIHSEKPPSANQSTGDSRKEKSDEEKMDPNRV